ncbi:PD-(D/E)XK nuclease family protein [Alkalihalobacillus pseudalcaliphilus]|uniref:PD-(D/E)XK nuclease family protein n=1 Tax=Alkalihalobacillus pseudalcaliphilus TaxID=79884 RepID=UPI00064DEDBD|nr:PD-(D/E)XK nuclease family protein [Alkalihalobacillus pseudalcaliphilus]KMK74729.1 hypothetical protein AB990_19790 [Alkalihalobacillus pseudalcaliphilus]
MHRIYGTSFLEFAAPHRLKAAAQEQNKEEMKVYYVLPSSTWLKEASERQKGPHYLNFDELAKKIIEQLQEKMVSISEQERTLFFQQFAERHHTQFDLYDSKGRAKGFADTYGQIKRLGLSLEDLPTPLLALKGLFQEYEKEILEANGLYDPENQLLYAIELIEKFPIQRFKLVIDGFYSFNPLQYLVIRSLGGAGMPIDIYLPNNQSFSIVEQTKMELEQMGFADHYHYEEDSKRDGHYRLAEATTNEEEMRTVLDEIARSSLPFSEHAILLADEREKNTELAWYAEQMGIPLQIPKKKFLYESSLYHLIEVAFQKKPGSYSKWEHVQVFEQLLALSFIKPDQYVVEKQAFIEQGQANHPEINERYQKLIQWAWPKKASFIDYLKILQQFLDELNWKNQWKHILEEEEDIKLLQALSIEWKALEHFENKLATHIMTLKERGLGALLMDQELFKEWLREIGQTTEIFIERAPSDGVVIHNWRDVGLFKGKKLFVLRMNEGIFPAHRQLSGYLHEKDLQKLPILNGVPTQQLARKSQEAFFQQLFFVADDITFSYIKGLDQENPLLPSPLLVTLNLEKVTWDFEVRSRHKEVLTEDERYELIAYYMGKAYVIPENEIPKELHQYRNRIQHVESFEESIMPRHQQRLRKNEVAVTALEAYARCPFKYAMERELQIEEPLEQSKQVSPLDMGSMVHDLIEEIYVELGIVGIPFAKISEEIKAQVPILVEDKFEKRWEEISRQYAELSQLDLLLLKKQWLKRLRKWWQAEKKHFFNNDRIPTMKIEHLEQKVHFDLPLANHKTLTLQGKVDRVDSDENGFVIYDYKTGNASIKKEDIVSGLKLQLPLYAYAISLQLSYLHNKEMKGYGASYISLKEPEKRAGNGVWRPELVTKDSPFYISTRTTNKEENWATEAYLDENQLKGKVEELWRGSYTEYPVKPLDCSDFCPFKPICRVSDEQKERGDSHEV